jgi:protein SCO1/2
VFCSRIAFFCVLAIALTGCQSTEMSCCRLKTADAGPTASDKSIFGLDSVWQDDGGKDFQLAELRGRPVVISMFFATCEGVCVITKDDMKAVEASLPAALRERTAFVLVTLAPDTDTPAALRTYRVEQGLSENRWRLLRGSPTATAQLATQLGIGYGRDSSGRFKHSSEVTVLDAAGKIIFRQDGIHADLAKSVQAIESAATEHSP